MDKFDPKRDIALILIDEPNSTVSSIDRDEPNWHAEKSDIFEPIVVNALKLTLDPNAT
jgi:hypothetical protein